jgi:hypothetical protein
MSKTLPGRIKSKAKPSLEEMSFEDYMEEAEICCEHARIAGRQRRYRAAIGLFTTAATLYRHAGAIDGVSYPAIEERLRHIDTEMSAYSELARSMSRPLVQTA